MFGLSVTILFTAMSVLCLEVSWMRLFGIESFSSFGYMILSVALLGFGVGGGVVTLFARQLAARRGFWLWVFGAAYPLAVAVSVVATKNIPFVPQNILQDPQQLWYIAAFYGTLCLPFVAGSLTIGLILTTAGRDVGRLYFADLLGSGLGGMVLLAAFYVLYPGWLPVLVVAVSLPALAAVSLAREERGGRQVVVWPRVAAVVVSAGVALAVVGGYGELRFSEYKGISYAMAAAEVTGGKVVAEAWGPLGYVQVVASRAERSGPGFSNEAPAGVLPPVQPGLYVDGSKVASAARALRPGEEEYLEWLLTSMPYRLTARPRVLVVGLGGGEGVAQAVHFRARSVTVAEISAVLVGLVRDVFSELNGGLLARPEVEVLVADGRDAARRSGGGQDLVVVSFLDASGLSFPGTRSLSENYLYTVEAFEDFLSALAPGGMLVVSTPVEEVPRGALRVLPGLVAAGVARWGREEMGRSIAYVRSQLHGMALVRRGGFSREDIGGLLGDAAVRGFTVLYHPGMTRDAVEERAAREDAYWAGVEERVGVDLRDIAGEQEEVQEPFFDCLHALLADADGGAGYLAAYPFDLTATTDDRPYFNAMLKAGSFEHLKKSAYDPTHWTREIPPDLWAQPVVLVTLAQALLFGAVILCIPALLARRSLPRQGKLRTLAYFSCLGLGYMFVEMVLIQEFTLYVAAPAYAAAVVVAGMLVFSGVGSGLSARLAVRPGRGILVAGAAIVGLALLYKVGLMPVLRHTIFLTEPLKLAVSILLVAPLALFMGMPFPLAMTVLSAREETRGLAAWGWAVNGAVSVVGVVLAQTLAMEHGFGLVLGLVAVLYAIAYLVFPRPSDPDPSNPVPPRRGPGSSRTASAVERGGA